MYVLIGERTVKHVCTKLVRCREEELFDWCKCYFCTECLGRWAAYDTLNGNYVLAFTNRYGVKEHSVEKKRKRRF